MEREGLCNLKTHDLQKFLHAIVFFMVKPMKGVMETKVTQYEELGSRLYTALQRYSNVHRGAGHYSRATTALFEKARVVVLEYLGLSREKYTVVFSSKWSLEAVKRHLKNTDIKHQIFSNDYGLPLGIAALAVRKNIQYRRSVFPSGGGTARLVSRNMIIWGEEFF